MLIDSTKMFRFETEARRAIQEPGNCTDEISRISLKGGMQGRRAENIFVL
jgi:hypothetical protein